VILGLVSAVGGWLGTTLGGMWADARRRHTPKGRLQVGAACPLLNLPLAVWMLVTENPQVAFVLAFPVTLTSSLWIGAGASTVQDLVLPRMRGSASAAYLLLVTFVGLALGPYTVGRLSVALGDLRTAMLCALIAGVVGAILLLAASRHVAQDEATRVTRARTAGERA
jgi:MFS family permease